MTTEEMIELAASNEKVQYLRACEDLADAQTLPLYNRMDGDMAEPLAKVIASCVRLMLVYNIPNRGEPCPHTCGISDRYRNNKGAVLYEAFRLLAEERRPDLCIQELVRYAHHNKVELKQHLVDRLSA